jgi:CheY-like chemotaxis protein
VEALMDEELLEAFRAEFAEGCAGLAAATTLEGARRTLASLRAMADGLGLAPLQQAIAALDEVEELGALQAGAQTLADLAAGREAPPAPLRIRTLIVDDSAMMRRLLRGILAADPAFEVVGEAADGAEALAALPALAPDLTLLDLEMPRLDGMGFLAEWALTGPGAVLVVSSAAQPGSGPALEVLRRGAWGAVAKPSGALSPDLAARSGEAILRAARAAAGV